MKQEILDKIILNEKKCVPIITGSHAVGPFLTLEHKKTGYRPYVKEINVATGECVLLDVDKSGGGIKILGEKNTKLNLSEYHFIFTP